MTLDFGNQEHKRVFNNADGFAMAFDDEWIKVKKSQSNQEISKEETIKVIMKKLKDHPFAIREPRQAKEIAIFRIKLKGFK